MKILNKPYQFPLNCNHVRGSPRGRHWHYFRWSFLNSSLRRSFELCFDYQRNCYILRKKLNRFSLREDLRLSGKYDYILYAIVRTSKFCYRAMRVDMLLFDVTYFSAKRSDHLIEKIELVEKIKK